MTPPIISCEVGLLFQLEESSGIYILTPDTILNSGSDNCSSIITYSIDRDTLNCEDLGTVDITLTAEDPSGNITSCLTPITVVYETPPNPIQSFPCIADS